MQKIEMYCVTDKDLYYLSELNYNLCAVGQGSFPSNYIRCDNKINIYEKEKNYSELTFHYWYWKNIFRFSKSNWIGFCQKRRFWIKQKSDLKSVNFANLKENILTHIPNDLEKYDSIICKPISVSQPKKIKIIKRGWKNLFKDPSILFSEKKCSIELHFDMHHGYGILEKAINLLPDNDREEFKKYVKTRNTFNPHIMFISKKNVLDKWFNSLFSWLKKCENEFGFNKLEGYDTTRLYAYLAERYLSFWFKKYSNYFEHPWIALDVRRDG
tara:strand:- start:211 stop:1020 length:810 start_codon:yes stop_codon:yes gene_type:complete